MDIKPRGLNYETMSVEELMRTKETLEDLIAEKELQEQRVTVEAGTPAAAEAYFAFSYDTKRLPPMLRQSFWLPDTDSVLKHERL